MANKTRDAILITALEAFGSEGTGQVSTNDIADILEISPGNVYYYFKSKREIIAELYRWFSKDFTGFLQATKHNGTPGEIWLVLSLCFQLSYKYRFIFRDANSVLLKFPELRKPFQTLLGETRSAAEQFCQELISMDVMQVPPHRVDELVVNVHLVFTQWISYAETLSGQEDSCAQQQSRQITGGVLQLTTLLLPYLNAEAVEAFSGIEPVA
ncbi:TetR/AcrR family transcriptional regulator [Motiliproteus coralliicola]|uniref:TetR/AcrR family transcriptional regulator n=1 Tax=Motiliproteus coralliicola TaxID=2283196 RepID=A0A369WS52_9GAMM|nr:TetR/AcrR family transcriptional regulator [Motiliproteus coralliicola]RDE24381.1 TetR/AcrR family transcriptional regulator [Motiliproteus coralliicola]